MVALRFTKLRCGHAATRGGQVFRAEFRQADQFITLRVTGIVRHEKRDVRVGDSFRGNYF